MLNLANLFFCICYIFSLLKLYAFSLLTKNTGKADPAAQKTKDKQTSFDRLRLAIEWRLPTPTFSNSNFLQIRVLTPPPHFASASSFP
jgi:hypothetical protein